mgnify:CR=1 FL=1
MSFSSKVCGAILKMGGWSIDNRLEKMPNKCVFCVAPHTSNWDFIVGRLCYSALDLGIKPKFLIKKFWTDFPFGLIIKPLGGIGVDRGKKNNLVDAVVDEMNNHESFQLAVTPEGTRKRNKNWKRGFYLISQHANVPLLLAGLDFKRKIIIIDGSFVPTGEMDKDIERIKQWYIDNNIQGRHPENFAV